VLLRHYYGQLATSSCTANTKQRLLIQVITISHTTENAQQHAPPGFYFYCMKQTISFAAVSLLLFLSSALNAQESKHKTILHAGIEIDALPYVTGGYFGAAWVSKDHWRARLLTADVNMPGFMTKKGFRNHHINSYAVVLDYFLKPDLKGWWAGGGWVYWKSRIQTDQQLATAHLKNYLLNGSIGYNFPVNKHIYISPWAGLSLRTGGDKNVPVDNLQYSIRLLNPEASLKIGSYF